MRHRHRSKRHEASEEGGRPKARRPRAHARRHRSQESGPARQSGLVLDAVTTLGKGSSAMGWWARWAWWAALALAGVGARELDPAGCAARFDVQRDKIIRTEESRDMGARYLAELDVGSRAECLRLCCETDACDVFVFEEKSPGSCYLFKCGPPEDFRCKFTAHGNFSSGVLALSRQLAELQDQQRLAQHQHDLERLRSVTSTSSAAPVAPVQPPHPPPPPLPPQQPTHSAHQPQQPQQPQQLPTPTRRCSRYQFECRRGGECIAVYNACDGVPQCADGSDEAPELGCPAPPPALPPPPRAPPAPPSAPVPTTPPTPPAPPQPPITPPPQTQPQLARAQVLPDAQEGQNAVNMQGMQPLQGSEGEADDEGVGAGGAWPRRLAQAQHRHAGAAGESAGAAPHIFSHQGGLLQAAPFAPAWPRRAWPADPPRNEDSMEGAGGAALGGVGGWGYSRLEPWVDERRAWPVPPRPEPEVGVYMPAKTMPELPLFTGQQAALRDAPKKGLELRLPAPAHPAALDVPAAPAAPITPNAPNAPVAPDAQGPDLREKLKPDLVENTTKKKASPPKGSEPESSRPRGESGDAGAEGAAGSSGAAGAEAEAQPPAPWADDHDGLSDHPPAAVLLLVLGSLMTVCLGLLVVCRARAARRRRRAHPRLALDADYLVNGMYL